MADYIRPTPRNPILGLLADALTGGVDWMRDPRRAQQMQGLGGLLAETGIPATMERLSYGEPLTKGSGMTTRLRPEAEAALMTLGPEAVPIGRGAAAAARAAERGVMAAGRAGEKIAERVVPQVMERGGLPAQMLEGMASQTVSPLTVYHGSPYRFQRFDPTKIGSGEGAQAYGYGHYVAESPDVANRYRIGLTKPAPQLTQEIENVLPDVLKGKAPDWADAIQSGKTFGDLSALLKRPWEKTALQQKRSALEAIINRQQSGGSLYTIDLPDPAIARMLDWDKPLSQQDNPALQQWFSSQKTYPGGYAYSEHTGETLYKALRGRGLSADQASAQLREAGIPGIRYLDQGSRGAGQGTSNFVVFPGEEDLLRILSVNSGLLGP